MIIIFSLKNEQTGLSNNLNILRKIQKSPKIDKDGNESVVTICYKIKLIDSARFMASS